MQKTLKHTLALFLSLVMVFTMFAGTICEAAEAPVTITVGNAQGAVGEIVAVDISISEGVNKADVIGALQLNVNYDSTKLAPATKTVKGEEVYFEKGMAAKSAEALTEATAGNPWQLGTVTTAGYWDGGVIWTLFFEIKTALGASGTPVTAEVVCAANYEDAAKAIAVDVVNGVVKSASAADQAAADAVIAKIAALPSKITCANTSKVTAARTAYNKLTATQKGLVDNLAVLTKAEAAAKKVVHTYKSTTTQATFTKSGKIVKKCSVCGKVASTTTLSYVKTVQLSATSYTYNGYVKTPTVTVKTAAGKTLKKNTDYTVTYSTGRKLVGTYKVIVKLKGNYSGTKTLTFKINPAATSVSSLVKGTKKITVNIKKKTTQITGYQVQYSTSKKFTGAKTKTISSYKTTKATLSSLKAKTTYYVRVRVYKKVNGVTYYSGWSSYKYTKTK